MPVGQAATPPQQPQPAQPALRPAPPPPPPSSLPPPSPAQAPPQQPAPQAPPPQYPPPPPPPQYQPPPYYQPPPPQQGTPVPMLMVGAMITSVVGAILLVVGEFAGGYWNTGSAQGWVYVYATYSWWSAMILGPLAMGLLGCTYIAYTGTRAAPSLGRLRTGLVISSLVTLVVFVLGLIFVGYAISEDWNDYWISEGGWGGLFGGLLTALFFFMALRQAKATAAPYQMPSQPMPQPLPPAAYVVAPPRAP